MKRIRTALSAEGHVFLHARIHRSAAPLLAPFLLAAFGLFFAAAAPGVILGKVLGIGVAIYGLLRFLMGLVAFAFPPIAPCIAVTRTRLVMVDAFKIRAWPIEDVDPGQVQVSFGSRFPAHVVVKSGGLTGWCDVLDMKGASNLSAAILERSFAIGTLMKTAYAGKVKEADEFADLDLANSKRGWKPQPQQYEEPKQRIHWNGQQWMIWDSKLRNWVPEPVKPMPSAPDGQSEPKQRIRWDGMQWMIWDQRSRCWIPQVDR